MKTKRTTFYSGTSGLVLPVPKSLYPPEFRDKSRLAYYASLYNSLEVNSSFYKMPMASTVNKWAAEVPEDFRFTFKLSKTITHAKGFKYNVDEVDQFMQTIALAGNKKGCLLIQFPPSLHSKKMVQVEELIKYINQEDAKHLWKIAVEFRNNSWYNQETYDLLKKHNISLVIHDLPASATPLDVPASDIMYLRFHGTGQLYRGSYTDDFLQRYAEYISAAIKEGKTIYFYFNNTMGEASKNLSTLNRMLKS